MREVPLADQAEALRFGAALFAGECDWLVLLTGVGTRSLLAALEQRWGRDEILSALARVSIACRGPKPVAVLKELALRPRVIAPEPNTWRELLAAFEPIPLTDCRLWVQEYGRPHPELVASLRARGAHVQSAAVYAWQLPEDLAPLEQAITALCEGNADAVVFTSGQQAEHLLEVARKMGRDEGVRAALRDHVVVAAIGPVTTAALAEHGIAVDLEPEHPKMGHLVKALVEHGARALGAKRIASPPQ